MLVKVLNKTIRLIRKSMSRNTKAYIQFIGGGFYQLDINELKHGIIKYKKNNVDKFMFKSNAPAWVDVESIQSEFLLSNKQIIYTFNRCINKSFKIIIN